LGQALEFTFSRWASGTRHEWALQWVNVGMTEPGYRYWDPRFGWIDTGIDTTLSPGWHRLEISGQIVSGGAKLRSISVDRTLYRLNVTVPSSAAPGSGDIAAVAVQLDGNSQGEGTPSLCASWISSSADIGLVCRSDRPPPRRGATTV
jgi:hypothetical protein